MTRHPVAEAVILSVNVGGIREVESRGRMVRTAIWKKPVEGAVLLRGVNLAGDEQVGSTLLEVAQPRLPCFKLGIRVGDATFLRRFQAATRPGAYLRVITEGAVTAGDPVRVVTRPDHGVTIALMAESITDPDKARAIQAAPQLPAGWRDR